jgi:hypothetical protein
MFLSYRPKHNSLKKKKKEKKRRFHEREKKKEKKIRGRPKRVYEIIK